MAFIEVDVDGVTVRALLNEEGAPQTTGAIWNALPFGGRAVHAQLSGDMFRMLDPAPVGELPLESETGHQHPGSVVFYPPLHEIAFSYGTAQFCGETGPEYVTPIAEIEGDLFDFGARADSILFKGELPISFRRAEDQETPFRHRTFKGPRVTIEFDGSTFDAVLLEDVAPQTVAAFIDALPLTGVATNDDWGGKLTRFRAGDHDDGEVSLSVPGLESQGWQVWPGYVYYDHERRRVYVCYGDSAVKDARGLRPVTPIAVLDGDWSGLRNAATAQLTEGAKSMTFKKTE